MMAWQLPQGVPSRDFMEHRVDWHTSKTSEPDAEA